jgi:hypothetical protein
VFFNNNFAQSVSELVEYGKRYFNYGSTNSLNIGLDDSPLYWRGYYTPIELNTFLPEARVLFFFRDPISRTLSSYKYFCLQERLALCTSEELTERIMQSIIFIRYTACNGTLGAASNGAHPRCREFRQVPVMPSPTVRMRWRILPEDVQDVWPANDVEVMRDWWRFWGGPGITEHVHRGGIMEGIYWPRLIEWVNAWPETQLMNVISDDFKLDSAAVVHEALEFYGIPDPSLNVQTGDRAEFNIAEISNRRSGNVKLQSNAERMLVDIFTPHLAKHAQVLRAIVERTPLPSIPLYAGTEHFNWLPERVHAAKSKSGN